jgi:Ca2+-binding EF-hand superfamily protein
MFSVHSITTVQATSVGRIQRERKVRMSNVDLDFGEFLIAISITAQQDPTKKLEWAFTMYGLYIA